MPAVASNCLYKCLGCSVVYLDPRVADHEFFVDDLLGPWVNARCTHCGYEILLVVGKVTFKPLVGHEIPVTKRQIADHQRAER